MQPIISKNKKVKTAKVLLEPLKLSFLARATARPVSPGLPCATCGRTEVPVFGEMDPGNDQLHLLCERCAVETFRTGKMSRVVAEQIRRRALDTPFLFAEMVLAQRAQARGYVSVFLLPERERLQFIQSAFSAYVTAQSRSERRELELLPTQKAVERQLTELLRFVDGADGKEQQGIEVPFSRESFERLLKLVYLGNVVVNGLFKKRITEYDALESYLFSLAREVGLGRFVRDTQHGSAPSVEFTNLPDMKRYKREYHEEIFWDELARRMADRDLRTQRGGAQVAQSSDRWYEEAVAIFKEMYEEEFDTHGIKRLVIDEEDDSSERESE